VNSASSISVTASLRRRAIPSRRRSIALKAAFRRASACSIRPSMRSKESMLAARVAASKPALYIGELLAIADAVLMFGVPTLLCRALIWRSEKPIT